jgi:hypothetical protein
MPVQVDEAQAAPTQPSVIAPKPNRMKLVAALIVAVILVTIGIIFGQINPTKCRKRPRCQPAAKPRRRFNSSSTNIHPAWL